MQKEAKEFQSSVGNSYICLVTQVLRAHSRCARVYLTSTPARVSTCSNTEFDVSNSLPEEQALGVTVWQLRKTHTLSLHAGACEFLNSSAEPPDTVHLPKLVDRLPCSSCLTILWQLHPSGVAILSQIQRIPAGLGSVLKNPPFQKAGRRGRPTQFGS